MACGTAAQRSRQRLKGSLDSSLSAWVEAGGVSRGRGGIAVLWWDSRTDLAALIECCSAEISNTRACKQSKLLARLLAERKGAWRDNTNLRELVHLNRRRQLVIPCSHKPLEDHSALNSASSALAGSPFIPGQANSEPGEVWLTALG